MGSKILIIGGGSGIGKELVHRLTDEGHEVIAASRSIASADLPDGVQRQEFDVTKDQKLSLPDELHGLADCPGTITLKPFNRISIKDLRQEMEINYLGAVKVVQQCVDALKREGQCRFLQYGCGTNRLAISYRGECG
ncbi:MAG: SDR family NAD(P)-dependent oxidoreductase [Owenweeksia sp.]|nr:SDR family NAD(P)-dependent oxidoreductase [Owenweeksia sp.]